MALNKKPKQENSVNVDYKNANELRFNAMTSFGHGGQMMGKGRE